MATNKFFGLMGEDNWGTPPEVVEAVHAFYGAPDLDPASDAFRNETVKATRFLGLSDVDPLAGIPTDWGDAETVFINPPGGKFGSKTLANLFWLHAVKHASRVDGELIWLGYNINQLQTLQRADDSGVECSMLCVPNHRTPFADRAGKLCGGQPSAQAILVLSAKPDAPDRFRSAFRTLGVCWTNT